LWTPEAAAWQAVFLLDYTRVHSRLVALPSQLPKRFLARCTQSQSIFALPAARTPLSGQSSFPGLALFANGHWALLMGEQPERWQTLRRGDHVMACFNADPQYLCHHPVAVIDFDASFMFESSQGPEGTC